MKHDPMTIKTKSTGGAITFAANSKLTPVDADVVEEDDDEDDVDEDDE
jgi:hypothetical protein